MLSRNSFINKIRELGYTFKTKQKRTELWRKKGGTHCIMVPLRNDLEESFVVSSLRQAGISDEEIQAFIRSAIS
jgi:hypothetical protein